MRCGGIILWGFVGLVFKGVVMGKVREGKYEEWVEEGVGRTRKRMAEKAKKGKGEEEEEL